MVKAFILVMCQLEAIPKCKTEIEGIVGVTSVLPVYGAYDLVVEVSTNKMTLEQVLKLIRLARYVRSTTTLRIVEAQGC